MEACDNVDTHIEGIHEANPSSLNLLAPLFIISENNVKDDDNNNSVLNLIACNLNSYNNSNDSKDKDDNDDSYNAYDHHANNLKKSAPLTAPDKGKCNYPNWYTNS